MSVSSIFHADPTERPFALSTMPRPRRQTIVVALACLLIHALLLAALFFVDWSTPLPPPEEDIPVEVVVMPPPQEQPAPQPPPPPPPPPPEQKDAPKPKPPVDLTPAHEIPRTETNKTKENDAQDEQSQAQAAQPREAEPPPAPLAATPPEPQPPAAADPASAPLVPDERPDLEALDKVERPQDAPPKPQAAPPTPKAPPRAAPKSALGDQFAALKVAPSFSIAKAAKPTPVGGGTGKATYTAILLGLIEKQMHPPRSEGMRATQAMAIIAFWLDDRGDLTHQSLVRTSGFPAFDAAAVEAVRRAAPFPAPPAGVVPSFVWNVSVN